MLITSPARSSPRLERRSVSGMASKATVSGPVSTAVRQTPFTAMLSPIAVSRAIVAARTTSRAPAGVVWIESTVPSASMIPVNIVLHVTGHQVIFAEPANAQITNAERLAHAGAAAAAHRSRRVAPTDDLGCDEELYPVHEPGVQKAGCHFRAALDQQPHDVAPAEFLQQRARVGPFSQKRQLVDFDSTVPERGFRLVRHGGAGSQQGGYLARRPRDGALRRQSPVGVEHH